MASYKSEPSSYLNSFVHSIQYISKGQYRIDRNFL